MEYFDFIGIIFVGLALGSFATVLASRIPLDLSIVTIRRSRCPSCHQVLGMADMMPLFSWIFLRGKCRYCRAPIGLRYLLIELATLLLCLMFYDVYGFKPETFLIFILAPVLVSILDIDVHHKIIPDSLNLTVLLTGVMLLLVNACMSTNPIAFALERGGDAVAGAFLYGAGMGFLRQVATVVMGREPMGMGDVKFYAAAGFWLGLNPDAASLFMIISGVLSILMALIWKKRTGEAEVPFGPSLVIALIMALYFCVPGFILL